MVILNTVGAASAHDGMLPPKRDQNPSNLHCATCAICTVVVQSIALSVDEPVSAVQEATFYNVTGGTFTFRFDLFVLV